MRLFLAVTLSDAVRAEVSGVQGRLAAAGAEVRWVEAENFHLTVFFLGDLSPGLLPDIEAANKQIAAETQAFRVRVGGGSYFPKKAPVPKTLWVGVTEGAAEWKTLVRRCEPWFVPMGAAREGGLVPHITLGRVKDEGNQDALKAALAAEAATDCGTQRADGLTLIESVLSAEGATYREIGFWPFAEDSEDSAAIR